MKEKRLLEICGEIDEKYVEEASYAKYKNKKTALFKWRMAAAACILIVCVITFPLFKNERNEQAAGDLAPMVFIDGTLYKASAKQTAFSKQKEEFEYLGEITDEVDPSMIPKKDFQANDFIKGAEVYLYNDDIVVQIGGKYWLYESCEETASAEAADYPMLIMIGGQLYHDSGEIITDSDIDEEKEDGTILSTCGGEPAEDDQSNFGAGYRYWFGEGDTILVRFEEGWRVFTFFDTDRDIDWDSLSEQEKMEIDPMYMGE